jgi:L-asparagine transporter-like permease
MAYWFPAVPGAVWVFVFAVALVAVNSWTVGSLGVFEYWLVTIKLAAIVVFAAVALLAILGLLGEPPRGLKTLSESGGLMPFGLSGVWFACCFVIYSFIGVEIVAITAGEASNPSVTIPRAMRRMVFSLSTIFFAMTLLLLAMTPWRELGVGESPFVRVLSTVGIPGAAGVMNFVVLSAAISSANANIYAIARTLFSLARGGYVPAALGTVNGRDAPLNALLVSSAGLGVAVLVRALWPDSAYVWFFGVALFGALFVWLMIFVTHIRFRGAVERPARGSPIGSYAGAGLIGAILLSTWWIPDLRSTLIAGLPWLAVLAVGYRLAGRRA